MKNKTFLLTVFLTVLTYTSLLASVEIQSKRLTTSDGLSNNTVRHIYQDSKGFIWMSTLNGLNRYDGNSFITIQPRNDLDIYLADHRGKTLKEDQNGFLWISTAADLFSCYDLKRDCFVDFTGCGEMLHPYRNISIFPDDIWLWGINTGCRRITYQNGKFSSEIFNINSHHLGSDNIRFLSQDTDGRIWIGTTEGLHYYEKGKMKCVNNTHYFQWACHSDKNNYFISSEGLIWGYDSRKGLYIVANIPNIFSERDLPGVLQFNEKWIIFTSQNTYSLDTQTHILTQASSELNIPNGQVIKDNRDNYWIFNKTGNLHYLNAKTGIIKTFQLMPKNKVGFIDMERYNIIHDSRDIIWITTYGNGLFMYNLNSNELKHITSGAGNTELIKSDFLLSIMEDNAGNIWVSSEFTGITCLKIINEGAHRIYPGQKQPHRDYSSNIRLISSQKNGSIWIGNHDGSIFVYDSLLSVQKEEYHYDSNIYAVAEDASGTIWKGSRSNGIYIGSKNYSHDEKDITSLSFDEVFDILKDSKGRMWIGTLGGGLNLAVPDKQKGYIFRHFFNKIYGLKQVRSLCEDAKGWFWVGTSKGIIVFHPDELLKNPDKFYLYNWGDKHLQSNEIKSVKQDSKGNIWIAESGAGFSICTPENDYSKLHFTHYGVDDGLVSSMVQGFVEDSKGLMWITTEYGISCFDPKEKTFQNYFFSSDMLSDVYSENSTLKLQDGRLIMGTNHGLVIINPQRVKSILHAPTVTFTELKVNGISIRPGDPDSPIDRSLAYAETIHLRYSQNSVMIDFSTLDFSGSVHPKFSYKLQNYDNDWSIPSHVNFAAYKNLSPGTYYLHVKACNAVGLWGTQDAVLKIVVTPPFWQTTWAFLLYALFVVIVLYVVYRIIHNMNELRYKMKVEKQLTEYKLVFFTNISHEFRTPLTLIQGTLERICRNGIPKDLVYSIKIMEKNTNRMLRLINQLLEFRKMQNNKLALSLEETDLVAFLQEIYMSFKDVAATKRMDFNFITTVASYKMFLDEGKLDKIIYNLLSNAFKYTPSGGKIDFSISIDDYARQATIKVIDSGVGIPKDKQNQLFKRFIQSSFSGSSVGVGLHLTHELVNVHKGTISYEDNPNGGSIFTVILSTDSTIYNKEDFLIPGNVLLQEEEILKKRIVASASCQKSPESILAEDNKGTEIQQVGILQETPSNKHTILIIDDDDDVRELLKEELQNYFEVATEPDGESGLEYASAHEVDLIICDVMMPGCSGFEVTQKIKGDFKTSHIPIILLTALSNPQSQLEGVDSGADDYITKPFSLKYLLARVFNLIEQRDKLRKKFSSDPMMIRPSICTNDKDKEFVEKLIRIMEQQLENPDFTVDDFASEMALGRTLFYKKVRGVTGYSPKEYIRIMRMKKAAELLGTYTVSEVSYKVGLNDPSYFSKCFKEQFGIAPSVYQKKINNTEEV
ncbi:hybrid sensor histidine kinase/response regulator transcription factor [Bacteroides finegoldii]|jgi:hypothetical protein|uniref:hybrid sensor histidine kinase/response regulator transcription factor n=1 Tax=Bacteroides finegoldii TaxID=338188 RepID=UPI00189CE9C0|nr:hybrid sensor histidine kinase/response regulator transcription factor [Bacteroides finegoldii]